MGSGRLRRRLRGARWGFGDRARGRVRERVRERVRVRVRG